MAMAGGIESNKPFPAIDLQNHVTKISHRRLPGEEIVAAQPETIFTTEATEAQRGFEHWKNLTADGHE
jgi:hypothetical protein